MKIYSFLIASVVFVAVASCQTQRESVQQGVSYADDYKMHIESYQDSVNLQLYYQTDRQQVFVPEGTIINIKKSDAN
ncbi:hypothetical protein [Myroides fluvii]|uniref:hypothetical protein n=1 Tax=Myroides fluvii TaxID=2572594 RepID=UPI00131C2990|nr:hypothetical protein [Myroides fluvii]